MDTPPTHQAVLDDVGPRLRRLRDQRGLTLAALAEATGISKSTLSRLESGGRRPSLDARRELTTQLVDRRGRR